MWLLHKQRQTHERVVSNATDTADQLAAIRSALREALAPKPLMPKEAKAQPVAPALIAKAKLLLARGDAEDRALAKIALGQHAEADRIIQGLKAKPGNPIDEAARLLNMEGNNWYAAAQADKAVEPYERVMALRPRSVSARNNVALAHTFARLGNLTEHRRRADEIADGNLKLVTPRSTDWAMTQNCLGIAWQSLPTGDRADNLRRAMSAYEAALTVYVKDASPSEWARTRNNLGTAWRDLPTGDRAANLRRAISNYESALTVFTEVAAPADWAMTQNNLGVAWADLPTGSVADNLQRAIASFEAALTVRTREAAPVEWAMTQNNLGTAWAKLPTGNRDDNLRRAIGAYSAALTVYTRDTAPAEWAATQHNLGAAWRNMHSGNPGENGRRAICAYEAALTVSNNDAAPADWAMIQTNLGIAWQSMPEGDPAENLDKAIAAFKNGLTVWTKTAAPAEWARIHFHLAIALADMAQLRDGDRVSLLARAIASDKAATIGFTPETYPHEHAAALKNLEKDRSAYEDAGGAAAQPFDAIRPAK